MTATDAAPSFSRNGTTAASGAPGRLPLPVILYLLCIVLPVSFQLGSLAMTTLRGLLLVMAVPLMVRLVMGGYGRIFLTDVLFFLHILWATMAIAINNPARVVENMGSVGVEFLGGYLMGRAYIRTADDFLRLARTLVFIVLCTLPFAIYEAQNGHPPIIEFLHALPGVTSVGVVDIEGRLGLERVQAVFAHPIHYGLFCSVVFSLAFVALKGRSATGWRWTSSLLVMSCGLLALSSGALLAILLQIGLIAWSSVFVRTRSRWWILGGLFIALYAAIDILSNRTPLLVFLSYATFSPHTAYWRSIIFEWGLVNIRRSPVIGIGLHDWIRPWFMASASVDNFWLLMAMRYGVPGLLLLAGGYLLALYRIVRRNLAGNEQLGQARRAWVFTFLGLSFTLCTVHVWTNVYSFVFFMFGAGMWLISVPAGDGGSGNPPPAAPAVTGAGSGARAAEPRYSRFAAKPPQAFRHPGSGGPAEHGRFNADATCPAGVRTTARPGHGGRNGHSREPTAALPPEAAGDRTG
jgi:hypothetical protein